MNENKRKLPEGFSAVILFTIGYTLCMGLRVLYFSRAGKSMICDADALEQHINALMAYGKWLRGIFYTLLHEHRLALQNYSFGIGLGGDFYTSMQYYAVGDPLNLPAAFLPSTAIYGYFQFLILLRPYLAGLALFLLFHVRKRLGEPAAPAIGQAAGALIYACSGTVLFIGMWNPFFVAPMITLPLLIAGVDVLIRRNRMAPFILAVFLAGITNFYFFYMQVIFLFGYFALRLIYEEGVSAWRARARLFGRFILAGAVGVLMAGVLLFPMFLALLDNPRAGGHVLPVLYESKYYLQLFKNFAFYIYHPLYDTELALTLAALPALIATLLFARRLNLKRERAELIVLLLMLCIPAAGFVMSGMSYVINRWCFAIALLAAHLVARTWEVFCKKRVLSCVGFVVALALILWNVRLADAEDAGNLPSGYIDRMSGAEFQDLMLNTEVHALRETVAASPDAAVRFSARNPIWNATLLHGISSTQFYWSLANGAVADFMEELAFNDLANYCFVGPEDRAAAATLMGVTHYSLRYDTPEEQRYVPAGFVRAAEYYNYAIYENAQPIGLGTVYDRVLPRSELQDLGPADREEALLHAGVLDDADAVGGVAHTSLQEIPLSAETVNYRLEAGEGVRVEEDGMLTVKVDSPAGGVLRVLLDAALEDITAETCLYLQGLSIVEGPYDIVNIDVKAYTAEAASARDAGEDIPSIYRTVSYKTPESEFYSGWHNYLVNFGSAGGPFTEAVIVFPEAGVYRMENLTALTRPVEPLLNAEADLAAHAVHDTVLNKNPISNMTDRISLVASAPEDAAGLLMLTIPWQRGWSATVDGSPAALTRANIAFTGLVLPPGTHQIELKYHTPGLTAGVIMSLLGIALLVLIARKEKSA